MEAIVGLVIIGLLLVFGNQLLKGMGNVMAVVGRIAGWVIGIGLIVYLIASAL